MEADIKKGKKKILIFILILLILGVLWFLYWLFYARFNIETDDSYVSGNQTIITSQVIGTVKEVFIEENQPINKGDLLVIIDDVDAKIALNKAEAQLGLAIKKYLTLQDDIKIANDLVEESQNNLTKATEDFNRDSKSYKAGLLSKESFENTKNTYKNSIINLRKNEQKLKKIETEAYSQNIYTHPIVAEAIEIYKKSYLNLERTKIYSPVSGITTKKSVFVGQQIHSGENIFTVIDLNNIWIDANYKETEMANFKVGNLVEFKSDYNNKKYNGYIAGISPASGSALSLLPAQNASGNWIKVVQRVPVRIAISEESLKENGVIPIGTSVASTIKIKEFYNGDKKKIYESSNLYPLNEDIIKNKVKDIIKRNTKNFSSEI